MADRVRSIVTSRSGVSTGAQGSVTAAFGGLYLEQNARAHRSALSPPRSCSWSRRSGSASRRARARTAPATTGLGSEEVGPRTGGPRDGPGRRPVPPVRRARARGPGCRQEPPSPRLGRRGAEVVGLCSPTSPASRKFAERALADDVDRRCSTPTGAGGPDPRLTRGRRHRTLRGRRGPGRVQRAEDRPDHALAAPAPPGAARVVAETADDQPGWPRFRVGLATGPAALGNVGRRASGALPRSATRRTSPPASSRRLRPGEILISRATMDAIGARRGGGATRGAGAEGQAGPGRGLRAGLGGRLSCGAVAGRDRRRRPARPGKVCGIHPHPAIYRSFSEALRSAGQAWSMPRFLVSL